MDAQTEYNSFLPVCIEVKDVRISGTLSVFNVKTVSAFLVLFMFFSFLGFACSEINSELTVLFNVFSEYVEETSLSVLFRNGALATLVCVLAVSLAGMTVFGRAAAVSVFAYESFSAGAVVSCATRVFENNVLQSFIVFTLLCASFTFVNLFYCCCVFMFSGRAFDGKNALFRIKPLISYFVFSAIIYVINLFLTCIFFVFLKS